METHPLSRKDAKRFIDAVSFWSWRKGWRAVTVSTPYDDRTKSVRATLVAKHRERDYG